MARRRSKRPNQEDMLAKRQALLWRLFWGVVVVISFLFGFTYGYPIAAEGDVMRGILVGLAYGGGAFLVIGVSLFLNRKLRGY